MHSAMRSSALVAGFVAAVAAQQVVPSASGFTYATCAVEPFYNGLQNIRALHGSSTVQLTNMTVEQCATFCQGFDYFGVEYGSECYCGNKIHEGTTLDNTNGCGSPCAGSSAEQCGGSGRMNLYKSTGAAKPNLPASYTPNNTVSTPLDGWNYVNCLAEPFYIPNSNTSARALSSDGTANSGMTVEYCATYCAGYQYFGVEYSEECYCGNSVDARTQLEACGKCNSVCGGNPGETCGGPGHLSLYKSTNATVPQFVAPSACSAAASATATNSGTATGSGSGSAPTTTGISCPTANGTTYSSAGQQFVVECSVDRQGGDLYALTQNSFGACLNYCSTYPGCVSVSYVGQNCYLKNVIMAPSTNPDVSGARLVSGAVSPNSVFADNGQQYNYLGVVNEPSLNNQGTQKALVTSTKTDNMMTLEMCASFCTQTSSTFFGVEGQNTCYCGNSFSTGSTQSIGTPQNPVLTCIGNAQEQCGGNQEMTTYALPGTQSPFDNTGKLVASSGSSSSSSSSATSSISSSTSSSSSSVSSTSSSTTTSAAASPTITSTAAVGSTCNPASATVCGNLAVCTLSGARSVCSLTTTSTATASGTCSPAAGTVCSTQVASCVATGNAATCSVTSTITAAASASCSPVEGTACSTNAACTAAANGGSTCQVTTTMAASRAPVTVGGSCAPSATPALNCQSFATCQGAANGGSTCAYQTTTQSASGSAAVCQPNPSSTLATVCGAGQSCSSFTGTTSTCGPTTAAVSTASMGNQCAPSATPATVCQATASCSGVSGAQTSICVKPTITASVDGGSCQPNGSPTATVCAATQSCSSISGTVSSCGATVAPTSTASMGNQCAPSASPATICGSTATCTSVLGAQTSTCARPTVTATANGASCQPNGTPTATVCAPTQSCSSVSGTVSSCGPTVTPSTTAVLGGQCAVSASPTATVCGVSTTCYADQSSTSTCGFPSTTVGVSSTCGNTISSTVRACNTASATCQANGNLASTCAYITATQTAVGGACATSASGVQPTACASGVATCSGAARTCARITSAATGFGDDCNVSPGPTAAATTCPGTGASCQSLGASSSTCSQNTITVSPSARCNASPTGLVAATVCQDGTATCSAVNTATSTCDYVTSTATLGAACNTAASVQTQCEAYATCSASKCARVTSTQSAAYGQCTAAPTGPVAATPCASTLSCAPAATGTTSICKPTATTAPSSCSPNFDPSSCMTVVNGTNNYKMWYGPANNGTYQSTTSGDLKALTTSSTGGTLVSMCDAAKQCAAFAVLTTPDDPSFGMVFVPSTTGKCTFYCGRFTTPTGPPFAQQSSAYSYSWGWST